MFQKAGQVQKKLKVLIYGPYGSGKTHLALTFPNPAVIDMEGGTELFTDRFDFSVLRTKDFAEVIKAVDYIAEHGGYDTLIIDPITVLWQVLMDAGQMMAEDRARRKRQDVDGAALTQRDWGIIKRKVNALYTRLVNMPCHVVVCGRIKDINENRGNEIVKVGEKVDAEKSTEYMFDIVLKLTSNGKRIGLVEKDRSGKLQGQKLEDPSFADFAEIIKATSAGAPTTHEDPSKVAEKVAKELAAEQNNTAHWIDDPKVRARFWAWTSKLTLTDAQVHTVLGVEHIRDYAGTMRDAKTAIEAWVDAQAEVGPEAES